MKVRMYAILDRKAEAGMQPFFSVNDNTAMRAVASAVNDGSSDFCRHAMDYTLYCIGEYDDSTLTVLAFPPLEVTPLVALKQRTNSEE